MTYKHLKILQYNIRNQKNVIMMSLLMNEKMKKFNELTIQEFGRNNFVQTSYNFSNNDFYLTYESINDMRVCFYINKNIDPKSGKIIYVSKNFCTLKMKFRMKSDKMTTYIHNVYNPSSALYAATNSSSIISQLNNALDKPEKHLFLSDFSLHHFYGKNSFITTQHAMINQLFDVVRKHVMKFTLPTKIKTGKKKNFINIINLIFMTKRLREIIVYCDIAQKLNQFSNHISIKIMI